MNARARLPLGAVLVVACAAQFMVVLDFSIVNVALPSMRRSLGLSTAGEQWVINAYALSFAGFLLCGGRAADLFGKRGVFLSGLGLFTLASALGGVSGSGALLVAARALQGLGGAVLAPATLSLLTTTYTEARARARALGAWSATAASGAAVGTLLGGLLTTLLGWRAVLFVNVPIGVALFVLARYVLVPGGPRSPARLGQLDLGGTLAATAGLTLVVYGIVSTGTHPWGSPRTFSVLGAGAVLLAIFLVIEARFAERPLMPLSLFANRSLSAANAVALAVGAVLFSVSFFLSLYLQQVDGYSALRTGAAFLPQALVTLVTSLSASRFVRRIGPRAMLQVGPLVAAGGLAWLSQLKVGAGYLGDMFGPLLLVGVGLGVCFVPMTLAATAGVSREQQGLASGIVNTSRFAGGSLGLAALATLAASRAAHLLAAGGNEPAEVRDHALAAGYDRAFVVAAVICVVAAALGSVVPGVSRRREPAPLDLASAEAHAGPRVRAEL
jgi:EmrB/QacA subfamily drug resistance transporter